MSILGSFHPQLAGLNRATAKVADVAARVADGKPLDPKAAVDLVTAERSFQANVKALQAADEVTGILIDVKT